MANLNLSEFTEKLFVADADHTFIWDTVGAISKRVSRNSWLNSGTLTSDAPVTISQTWNAGSNVMTALRLNVTDTASGSTSKLLELYAGATPVSVLEVDKIGRLRIGSTAANAHGTRTNPAFRFANNNSGFYTNAASGYINFAGSGTSPLCFSPAGIILSAGAYFQWTSGVNDPLDSSTVELALLRDAANTLALRNGTAAQVFNVYNTYTNASNYERAVFGYGSNQINLGSDVAGSGVHRKLNILGAGIDFYHAGIGIRWSINTSGHFLAATDNQYDIGASGANRPRNVYVGSNVISRPAGSITPANNGEFVVEATSNTTLTFKLKGTDGTVRSGTITLSV